ncbi:DUF1353 domain-containing protein [Streptomyces sp. SID12501]|uniref:DUF1353 domain-containing protein n=1 Tax=Streptomyces sp. SID12501 TaxID=2706042 RepID=A0A6B3BPK5_9ACTN|nr:DUF1353 domain-containing protein [Streptomyces sp. SID12501]NEC86264.1 DUF1353 domain-containing protein [Streptomyces sp. SID12501]
MIQDAEQPIAPDAARFYDGGVDADEGQPGVPPDPACPPRIELVRTTENGCEEFKMLRRIAYNDEHLGELLVPRRTRTFCSDLTSVPTLFTWLVPKTGEHLPAALLHDGLVHPPGDPTYTSTDNHVVTREQADRVLRDAMGHAGTKLIRRWLIWSAVAMVTMLNGKGTGWSNRRKWYYRLAVGVTLSLVLALGIYAFIDLFDLCDANIPKLPWMGDRPWFVEVVGGLAGAIVIPLVLALFWGRFRIAGAVVGVSLAVLLPVTVALLVPTGIYQVLEFTAKATKAARWPALVVGVVALVVWLALSGTALFQK